MPPPSCDRLRSSSGPAGRIRDRCDREAAFHQRGDGLLAGSTRPDQANDLVHIAHGEDQSLESMGLLASFAKEVLGAAANDVVMLI